MLGGMILTLVFVLFGHPWREPNTIQLAHIEELRSSSEALRQLLRRELLRTGGDVLGEPEQRLARRDETRRSVSSHGLGLAFDCKKGLETDLVLKHPTVQEWCLTRVLPQKPVAFPDRRDPLGIKPGTRF